MLFHLLIDVIGEALLKCVNSLVQIIISDTGGITADSIDCLSDKFIKQVGNLVIIHIIEVNQSTNELLYSGSFRTT